jgi:hypothetical protein
MFSPLSASHHIKYAKRYKFGVLNVDKQITNYTILMYFATRILVDHITKWWYAI